MNSRHLSILLGAFIFFLSGCGGGGGSSSGQATLTVSVAGIDKQVSQFQAAPAALEKVVDFVFPKAYAGSNIPAEITRLIVTVTDLANHTIASGDVIATGGVLTVMLPANVAFTVTAQAFNINNKLLYSGTSYVAPLVSGQLAHISINMTVSNVAPVANDAAYNNVFSGTLPASDTNGDTLTFSIVSQPTKGTVIIDAHTGAYTYTPNPGASGTDSFTFKVNDGAVDSNVATVTIIIDSAPGADIVAPVANNVSLACGPDGTDGILSAIGFNGDTLTYSIVSQPTLGTVIITDVHTGAYTYTPYPGSSGTDSFTFKVNNGAVDSNIATVTIDISPGNIPPVASDDTLNIGPDGISGTLHASDANGGTLIFSIVSQPALGTVTITDVHTGAYTYTPYPGSSGTDSFTFKVNDGAADSNIATVTIDISPGNIAPVASGDTLSIGPNGANGTLHASDANGDVLTFSIVSQPKWGKVTITNAQTGAYIYIPNPEESGTTDSFTFRVNDGTVDSNVATVTVVMDSLVVYNNGFDNSVFKAVGVTESLSINAGGTGFPAGVQGFAGLGPKGNKFSGKLKRVATGTTVTLTLGNLPAHSALSLQFLFAAIDSLDGTGSFPSGDYFNVTVDGVSIFRESFENATGVAIQSYVPPVGGELARRVDLGFSGPGGYYTDSAYNMVLEPRFHHIAHTASSVTITFRIEGNGIQDLSDESWGMDNLNVILHPPQSVTP